MMEPPGRSAHLDAPPTLHAGITEPIGTHRQDLTTFVVENPELERLEQLLAQFNIFDAIGVARQELRHSDFLAFLLDPQQPHGLRDVFAKRLIQRALMGPGGDVLPVSPIDLDLWSLERLSVVREWQNIDILLLDEDHQFAVVIENKIGSGEHSGQLAKYFRVAQAAHPKKRIIALYLTPEGSPASDDAYLSLDYGQVCNVTEALVESRGATLDPAVSALMSHYARMLRRHVVADSEIAELCRSIYHKHRPALDLIFEHRPDEQAKMYDFLVSLVEGTPGIILDDSSKQYIRFWPEEWDIPELRVGSRWTSSGRMLLFQLVNVPDRLNIALVVGPGPESVRQDLSRLIREAPAPLKLPGKVGQIWATVYSRKWLSPHDYEDSSPEERESRVRESWQRFLETDLRAIHEALGMPTLATRLQQESQPPYESLNPGHPSLSS